jgi:hypothetical protein
MSKQIVQNERELGLTRSTRLEKRDKTKLHHSLEKRLRMMLHMHKRQVVVVQSVHYFLKPQLQVVHKQKDKLLWSHCFLNPLIQMVHKPKHKVEHKHKLASLKC